MSAESDAKLDALLAEVARPPTLHTGLLQAAQQCVGVVGPFALEDPPRRALLEAGTVIDGRYRVQHVLGHGGMGVVYAAESLQTGRRVAVKCIALRLLSDREGHPALARFRREARAVASIRHPNVVDVYDAGGQGALPYLVMELLDGESLRVRLQRGPMGWDEVRSLVLPLLAGLAAAHRAGVVHRDIKPDNIFLAAPPGSADVTPKLLDFGIASVRETAGDATQSLTNTGAVLGTPSYMAPEQLTGGPVDVRTDVYGMGVVLYEMLSGQLPFAARTAPEVAVLQATRVAVPLSQHCPGLRGSVEQVIMRALARSPLERYPSVDAFAAAMRAASVGRRRAAYRLWLGVGLMLLAGVGVWFLAATAPSAPQRSAASAHGASPTLEPAPPAPERSEVTAPEPATTAPSQPEPSTAQPPANPTQRRQAARSPRSQSSLTRPRARFDSAALPKAPTDLSVDEF